MQYAQCLLRDSHIICIYFQNYFIHCYQLLLIVLKCYYLNPIAFILIACHLNPFCLIFSNKNYISTWNFLANLLTNTSKTYVFH